MGIARLGPQADSILLALRAADLAVIVQVLQVEEEEGASIADLRVLESLMGGVKDERLRVRSMLRPGGQRLPMETYPERGETILALLSRSSSGEWRFLQNFRATAVHLREGKSEESAAASLVRGYLPMVTSSAKDSEQLKGFLTQQIAIGNETLRTGVLFDLGELLKPQDVPFLASLFTDRARPEDVRVWAIYELIALRIPTYPDELQTMLDPSESVSLRKAALQAFGARRSPTDLPLLRRGFDDPSADVRRVAIEQAGLPEAVPLLQERYSRESSQEVRLAIVREFGEIGTASAITALDAIRSQAAEETVQRAAELALAAAHSKQTAP